MQLPSAPSGVNLQSFSLKKFLIFFLEKTCPEKVSHIFSKKVFLTFRKRNFSYISGKVYSEPWHNRTFLYFWKWSFLTFQEVAFRAQKNEKNPLLKSFLYFGKLNFLAASLKNFYFSGGNWQSLKNKKNHIFCLLRENFSNISA